MRLTIRLAHGLRHELVVSGREVSSAYMELGANQAYAGEYHQRDSGGGAEVGPECTQCVYASDFGVRHHLRRPHLQCHRRRIPQGLAMDLLRSLCGTQCVVASRRNDLGSYCL